MKIFFGTLVTALFATSAFATCPSIDGAIQGMKTGTTTYVDVNKAILCQLPTCDFKVLTLTNILAATVDLVAVGEAPATDIYAAAKELKDAKAACSK